MLNLNAKCSKYIYVIFKSKSKCKIHTACNEKYPNESSFTRRWSDCTALLVMSPHRALVLPASMSSNLAGNIGRAVLSIATASTTAPGKLLFLVLPVTVSMNLHIITKYLVSPDFTFIM